MYIYNIIYVHLLHTHRLSAHNEQLWALGLLKTKKHLSCHLLSPANFKRKTKARDLLHLVAFKFQPLLSTWWHSAPWNGQFSCSISDLRWGWPQIWRVSALTVIPVTSMTYNCLPTIKSIIYIHKLQYNYHDCPRQHTICFILSVYCELLQNPLQLV